MATLLGPCVVVFAAFLLVGIAVVDDYGITTDEETQRHFARTVVAHVLESKPLPIGHNRWYGVAFELPALLVQKAVEQALGVENSRLGWLVRHFLIHLSFLGGGICAYLLALRLFGSRLCAVVAMLLFLLHPRLYGHSFYNSKDIPFLSVFMMVLYLAYWSFDKNNIRAFVTLGLAAGVLVNLRIMGVVLIAAVVAMRCADVVSAGGSGERRRALATAAVFLIVCALTLYVISPALWANPVTSMVDAWRDSSNHVNNPVELYAGIASHTVAMPWHYAPVWFLLTTPPFVVLLAGFGVAHVLCRSAKVPRNALCHAPLRFAAMLVGLTVVSLLAIVLLADNIYNGWRQLYFVYAPISLLAVFGMCWLRSLCGSALWRISIPVLAGLGITANAASMASIHPYENVYFNFLVDRHTPERLGTRWTLDFWEHPVRHAVEYLLQQDGDDTVAVHGRRRARTASIRQQLRLFAADDRRRLIVEDGFADFAIGEYEARLHAATSPYAQLAPVVHAIRVYDNTLYVVTTSPTRSALSALDKSAAATDPVARDVFDIHVVGHLLVYVKEPCSVADIEKTFLLQFTPVEVDDLPLHRRRYGFDSLDFEFHVHGMKVGDRCIAALPTPGYALQSVRTGQWLRYPNAEGQPIHDQEPVWEVSFALSK